MENGTLTAGALSPDVRSARLRASAVLAALALVLTMFVLVQQPADAAPGSTVAAAAVVTVGAAEAAQINFNQIICAALISIRNSFASSPFFGFVAAIINQFVVGFGCAPS